MGLSVRQFILTIQNITIIAKIPLNVIFYLKKKKSGLFIIQFL